MKGLLESVGLSPEIIAKYCKAPEKKKPTGLKNLSRKEYYKAYLDLPGKREKSNARAKAWYYAHTKFKKKGTREKVSEEHKRQMKNMCSRRLRAERKGSKEVFPKRIRRRMKF